MYKVPSQAGKLCVVTGANSGTGKEAARRLAGAGASVVLAVRSLDKGERAREEILTQIPSATLEVRQLDLADLSSVQAFAEALLAEDVPVDVLINNGGVMAPPKRIESSDGFELQFATNFLGHFALTLRLLPLLLVAAGPTVSTMSSGVAAFGRVNFEDLQREKHYSPYLAYAQSKLADLLFAQQLARVAHERNWDLMSNAAHPGYTKTNLFKAGASLGRDRPRPSLLSAGRLVPGQSVEQGSEPLLYAATSPDAISGAYYGPSRLGGLVGPTTLVKAPRSARKTAVAEQLWRVAEGLTGLSVPDAL